MTICLPPRPFQPRTLGRLRVASISFGICFPPRPDVAPGRTLLHFLLRGPGAFAARGASEALVVVGFLVRTLAEALSQRLADPDLPGVPSNLRAKTVYQENQRPSHSVRGSLGQIVRTQGQSGAHGARWLLADFAPRPTFHRLSAAPGRSLIDPVTGGEGRIEIGAGVIGPLSRSDQGQKEMSFAFRSIQLVALFSSATRRCLLKRCWHLSRVR